MSDIIALVLPTLPSYRFDFLRLVKDQLKQKNKKIVLFVGTNVKNKDLREINNELDVKIVRSKTVGFKIFNLNLNWQKSLISSVIKSKPEKVVIMLHTGKINYLLLLTILKVKGTPFIVWGSGYRRVDLKSSILNFKHRIKAFFENLSSGYITYSEYFARKLKEREYNSNKIIVAQNTIHVESIVKKNLDFSGRKYKKIYFLFVGALIPQKRLENAIYACRELQKKGYNFIFDIVGGGTILKDLENLVKKLNLEEFVHLHGPKYGKEVEPFFKNSNVFLLPGTGGLAVNEAMAYSLPVISTPGDGTVYDLVDHKVNGFILEYNYSNEELVTAMEYFVNLSQNKLQEMEKRSSEIIMERASLQNMADKFVEGVIKF